MQWFEEWFNTPYYHILYNNRDYKEAENFITLLIDYIKLEKQASVIDLACGKGRHSVYLNKMGYQVLGLDLSEQSILFDKQFENETLKFRVHDMRNPINSEPVDAVFNLFTSFGYFETEEEDKSVFSSVANALNPNGYFVLDFLNADYVKNHVVEKSIVDRGELKFNIHKYIDKNYIVKEIDFEDKDQQFHFFERVKLTPSDVIIKFAEEFGFELIQQWGDYQLSGFDKSESSRCINLFRKK